MADRDTRSPLAQLNQDLNAQELRDLAMKLVKQVKGPFDADIESRCALAILRAQMGQLEEARELLEEARLIAPTNLMSYNLRIQLESQAGPLGEGDRWMRRHARIEGAINRGRPLNDNDVDALNQRTKKVQARGSILDLADIIEDFLLGDSVQPGLSPTMAASLYHRLGDLHTGLGEHEDAWRCYSTAALLSPHGEAVVTTFMDAYPDNPDTYATPEPSPEAYGLEANAQGQHAAEALANLKVTVSAVKALKAKLATQNIINKDVLDIGGTFPPAFTSTLKAKSWLSLTPQPTPPDDSPSEDSGDTSPAFRLSPMDLSNLDDAAFDVVLIHGSGALRPGLALEAAARALRPGGHAIVELGPAWSSAWGHNMERRGKESALPDWAHLVWGQEEYSAFARCAGLNLEDIQPGEQGITTPEMLKSLRLPALKLQTLKVVKRAFPLPHVKHLLTETQPGLDNVYDWGYEVVMERV